MNDFLFPGMNELGRVTPKQVWAGDPRALMIKKRLAEVQGQLTPEQKKMLLNVFRRHRGNLGGLLKKIGEGPYPEGFKGVPKKAGLLGGGNVEDVGVDDPQLTFDSVVPPRGSKGEIDYNPMKTVDREVVSADETQRLYEQDTATEVEWLEARRYGRGKRVESPLAKELKMMAQGRHPTGVMGDPLEMMSSKAEEIEQRLGPKLRILEESRDIPAAKRSAEQAAAWASAKGVWKEASNAFEDVMEQVSRVDAREADAIASQMPEVAQSWLERVWYFSEFNKRGSKRAAGYGAKAMRLAQEGRWTEAYLAQKIAGVWSKADIVDYGPVKREEADELSELFVPEETRRSAKIGGKRLELGKKERKIVDALERQMNSVKDTGQRYKPEVDPLTKALHGDAVQLKRAEEIPDLDLREKDPFYGGDPDELFADMQGHDDFYSVKTTSDPSLDSLEGKGKARKELHELEFRHERQGLSRLERGTLERKALKTAKASEMDNVIALLRRSGGTERQLTEAIERLKKMAPEAEGTLWEGWVGNKMRNTSLIRAAKGGAGAEALEELRNLINIGKVPKGMKAATLNLFKALSLLK